MADVRQSIGNASLCWYLAALIGLDELAICHEHLEPLNNRLVFGRAEYGRRHPLWKLDTELFKVLRQRIGH